MSKLKEKPFEIYINGDSWSGYRTIVRGSGDFPDQIEIVYQEKDDNNMWSDVPSSPSLNKDDVGVLIDALTVIKDHFL